MINQASSNPSAQPRLSLKWLYVAWFGLAFTMFVFVLFGMIERGDPTVLIERLFGDASLFAFWLYTIGLVIAVLILRYLLRRNNLRWQDVGLKGSLSKRGALYAAIGWFCAFWLFYIVDTLTGYIGVPMFWHEGEFIRLDSILHLATIPVATVIIAPVAEEIIYRGYVLTALLERLSTPVAVVLSAAIFASVHIAFGPGMVIYIFFGAFILAYLYLKFGNICPCILMHLFNNVVAYIVIPLVVD